MGELTTLIDEFLAEASAAVDQVMLPSSEIELRTLSDVIVNLSAQASTLGDTAWGEISSTEDEEPLVESIAWPVLFEWIDDVKHYLILWRDTLFQYNKGLILLEDHKVVADDIGTLHIAAVEHLREATQAIHHSRPNNETVVKYKSQIEEWKLLANPWPAYKEQIGILGEQAVALVGDYEALSAVVAKSRNIAEVIKVQSEKLDKEIAGVTELINNTREYITEHQKDPKKISAYLETIEQNIETTQSLEEYQLNMDGLLTSMNESIGVPISIAGGPLSYQEVNFGKQIRQWLDTEIQPSVHEMADLTNRVSNSLKMALINIRNRAIILSKETSQQAVTPIEAQQTNLHQPLDQIAGRLEEWEADLSLLYEVLNSRLKKSLSISEIYNGEEEFLPVPLQVTLTQFRLDQYEILGKIKRWTDKQWRKFSRVKDIVIREEALSDADKIVRYVRGRTIKDDRHQYDSIFKAQGYIGESFCVGRAYELGEIEGAIQAWEQGYRGSAVLTGWRHSGKTLFGEWVSQKHFPNNTIHVRTNNVLTVGSRKLTTGYDLNEALEFIKKHSLNKRYFIWIDDIENWESADITIGQNVNALKKHMDDLSNRLYFFVAMAPWTFYQWNELYALQDSFQTTINLRPITDAEVREAILIRHGATHKRLVDEMDVDINSIQFGKMVKQVHRLSQGVIGDTFLLWANGTKIGKDDKVLFEEPMSFALPDFLNPDISILLRYILLRRTTSEYELRKSFGKSFKGKYSNILQRMISMGVITRRIDERLEITNAVVNDVARLLEEHAYITITTQS